MRSLGFLFCLSVLCLGISACESSQNSPQYTEEELAELISFGSVGRGLQASLDTTVTAVITDSTTWMSYSDSLQPIVSFTSVNFELETLLLAAVKVNSGGYDLRFELVESLRDTLVATYRLFSPGDDCRPSYAVGIPFEVIRIPQRPDPIRFVQIDEAVDCTSS
ncbi:MAG: hypothetical protein OXF06_02330 [Bacteroidetes bacterium]|nr:hypothetical protein [Bacteroidota bacterium]